MLIVLCDIEKWTLSVCLVDLFHPLKPTVLSFFNYRFLKSLSLPPSRNLGISGSRRSVPAAAAESTAVDSSRAEVHRSQQLQPQSAPALQGKTPSGKLNRSAEYRPKFTRKYLPDQAST